MSAETDQHLRRLVASWRMLADLCFSDLVLYRPIGDRRLVMVNHIRPTTAPTIYHTDLVGQVRTFEQRPLVAEALRSGRATAGEIDSAWLAERIRVAAIPVRHRDDVVAVLAREYVSGSRPHPGELERTYLSVFDRFAAMIESGTFPYEHEVRRLTTMPTVGDGVIVTDAGGAVVYASPNATSAMLRLGADANLLGRALDAAGLGSDVLSRALADGAPGVGDVEGVDGVALSLRAMPLAGPEGIDGAVLLVRDVSDLRERDRLLVSKDATIREIHHRVKNNLQTISSLLRLQGRRLREPSAIAAIEESVRRIRSIALVHETLSREVGDDVPFRDVIRPLVRMVEEGLVSPDRPVRFRIDGDVGVVPSAIATPLALVVTELLQNVVEHAYPESVALADQGAEVVVALRRDDHGVCITMVDNGVGVPDALEVGSPSSLGLTIVDTLVTTELRGTIEIGRGSAPLPRPGTRIEVRVPTGGPADW